MHENVPCRCAAMCGMQSAQLMLPAVWSGWQSTCWDNSHDCCAQVVAFQREQVARAAARQTAQATTNVQAAMMAQLAVREADTRVDAYGQMLLQEATMRGLPTRPIERHLSRAAKKRSALTPSM